MIQFGATAPAAPGRSRSPEARPRARTNDSVHDDLQAIVGAHGSSAPSPTARSRRADSFDVSRRVDRARSPGGATGTTTKGVQGIGSPARWSSRVQLAEAGPETRATA